MPERQLRPGVLYNPVSDPGRFRFEAFLTVRGVLKGSGIHRFEGGGRYAVVDLDKLSRGEPGAIIESNLPQYQKDN